MLTPQRYERFEPTSWASPAEAVQGGPLTDGATRLPKPAEVNKLPTLGTHAQQNGPCPEAPPSPRAPLPKRPSRCEPSTLGEPGARELRRRPAATRRRLSRRTPRRPRAGKILPSETPGFPAGSSHRGLFTRGPDLGLTGSRQPCQSEWPTDQSPCFPQSGRPTNHRARESSSALRPFGPSALRFSGVPCCWALPGPSAALESFVLLGLISPFFSDTSGSCVAPEAGEFRKPG